LGEQFLGSWQDKDGVGETTLVAEQGKPKVRKVEVPYILNLSPSAVSHHPPVTAYHLENKQAKVSLEGHNGQKSHFSGNKIEVRQSGHALLRVPSVDKKGETLYLITLPQLVLYGILTGSPYIELQSNSYICSSTGYLATISYAGKGYFSGKAHCFKAAIAPASHPTQALYSIEGEWSGTSKFKGASPSGGKDAQFWDANTDKIEVSVKPVEEQGDMESRKLWKKTADGIKSQNYDAASKDKTRIEVSTKEPEVFLQNDADFSAFTRTSNARSARTSWPMVHRISSSTLCTSMTTRSTTNWLPSSVTSPPTRRPTVASRGCTRQPLDLVLSLSPFSSTPLRSVNCRCWNCAANRQ
jgi:hypothetical protein